MTFSKNEDTSDLVGFLLVVVVGLVLFVGWLVVGWLVVGWLVVVGWLLFSFGLFAGNMAV